MFMSETESQELISTVQQLAAEVTRLRERVEDLEDARELDRAIGRNGEKPLIPWDQAKNELNLS
jgi:cell division protein FtsB